jgi:hypothetical protein
MTPTPTITGIKLASNAPRNPGADACLAILTVEYGPWIIGGVRYCAAANGRRFLKPPLTKDLDRVVLRAGPERDVVLAEADRLFLGMSPQNAVLPVATAPHAGATNGQSSRTA